jgi:hypothetical protein
MKGRKHGHGFARDDLYSRSLCTKEGPLPDMWQTRYSQTGITPSLGSHRRVQEDCLPGDNLRV